VDAPRSTHSDCLIGALTGAAAVRAAAPGRPLPARRPSPRVTPKPRTLGRATTSVLIGTDGSRRVVVRAGGI